MLSCDTSVVLLLSEVPEAVCWYLAEWPLSGNGNGNPIDMRSAHIACCKMPRRACSALLLAWLLVMVLRSSQPDDVWHLETLQLLLLHERQAAAAWLVLLGKRKQAAGQHLP